MIGGRLAFPARVEHLQIDPVVDHPGGRRAGTVHGLPPVAGEVALVDDPIRQVTADERQQPVVYFRAQVMPQASPAFAVDPIHAVQTLHNAHPPPPRLP